MHDWIWWLIAALAFAAIEVATVDLIFIMAAAGAGVACVLALAGASVVVQVAAFVVVSVILLGFIRPVAMRHLKHPPISTNTDLLLGKEAFVVEQVDGRDGRVKLGGEVWSARSNDDSAVHPVGSTVHVVSIAGATVLVS